MIREENIRQNTTPFPYKSDQKTLKRITNPVVYKKPG
jgi:hypothetical protein